MLNGLDGRKSGTIEGYSYTDANKNSGITWDEAVFKEYIKDPRAKIPGTKMIFAGIKNENETEQPVGLSQAVRRRGQEEVRRLTCINAAGVGAPRPDDWPAGSASLTERAMIKDLVVNLSAVGSRDVAGAYAISIAESFRRARAGVAFSYEPVIPPTIMGGIPASLIESQRAENDKAANDALRDGSTRPRGAPACRSSRARSSASLPGAADRFGAMARRFDLAVVGQAEPDTGRRPRS